MYIIFLGIYEKGAINTWDYAGFWLAMITRIIVLCAKYSSHSKHHLILLRNSTWAPKLMYQILFSSDAQDNFEIFEQGMNELNLDGRCFYINV
jgi:hypothetical protein